MNRKEIEKKLNDEMLSQSQSYLQDTSEIERLIRTDLIEDWRELYGHHTKEGYDAMCVAAAVQIMQKISNGAPITKTTLKTKNLPGLSSVQASLAYRLVYTFHPRGEEFKSFHDSIRNARV